MAAAGGIAIVIADSPHVTPAVRKASGGDEGNANASSALYLRGTGVWLVISDPGLVAAAGEELLGEVRNGCPGAISRATPSDLVPRVA